MKLDHVFKNTSFSQNTRAMKNKQKTGISAFNNIFNNI